MRIAMTKHISDGSAGRTSTALPRPANLPIGMRVVDSHNQHRVIELISEDRPLPCKNKSQFRFAADQTKTVKLTLTAGNSQRPEAVRVLGEIELTGLDAPQGTPMQVTLHHNGNRLTATLSDLTSGRSQQAQFNLTD